MIFPAIINRLKNLEWTSTWKGNASIFLIFFLFALVIRLPHMLSHSFFFDGDEAVVGIQGQDLLAARHWPMYFYGQNYGLSIFEAFSCAFWIKILGSGIWALRLAGLTLFTIGSFFLFKGLLRRELGFWSALICTLLFLSFPSWMLWGTLVRGGYVTAIMAICILYYLFARIVWKPLYLTVLSFWLAVAVEAHILLLVPIAAFFLYDWVRSKPKMKYYLVVPIVTVLFIFLFRSLNFNHTYWNAPTVSFFSTGWTEHSAEYGKGILNAFGNFYYYTMNIDIPGWWMNGLFVLLSGYVIFAFSRFLEQKNVLFLLLWILGVFLLFIIAFDQKQYIPRYLLGVFTSLLFLVFFLLKKGKNLPQIIFLTSLLVIQMIGSFSGSKMKRDWYNTPSNQMDLLEEWHKEVENKGFKAIFITDNLIPYQWNYLYGQSIPACAFRKIERTNDFSSRAYSIYRKNPKDVSIGGLWGLFLEMDQLDGFKSDCYPVNEKYFLLKEMKKSYHDVGVNHMR